VTLTLARRVDLQTGPGGGRTWWAHFEFTRINTAPTFLDKRFEDLREAPSLFRSSSGILNERAFQEPVR
jgi:hypothetical protein